MDKNDLKQRTKKFALDIIKFSEAITNNTAGFVIKNQLIKAGTSVGANYRAACRARSISEFIAKLGIVIEEADESAFWLEIIIETNLVKKELVEPLPKEANEITAIMIASSNSASKNLRSRKAKFKNSEIYNLKSKI